MLRTLLLIVWFLVVSARTQGLEPKNVFIMINSKVPDSRKIAEYYCEKREVPVENIIALELPTKEDISRADYQSQLVKPLRKALKKKQDQVKCLLTIYGVPLRVGNQSLTDEEKKKRAELRPQWEKLRAERAVVMKKLKDLQAKSKDAPSKELEEQIKEVKKELNQAASRYRTIDAQWKRLSHGESKAAVDSELSLLWRDNYPLDRWQMNELYWRNEGRSKPNVKAMIMVARLDGPSPKLVKRLIDDALLAEKKGLQGKVYVDARGITHRKGASPYGYSGYDQSLRDMASYLKEETELSVVLDNKSALFKPQSCPECALYCGWYSHAKFVDCCQFVPGAVAYHIASSEAVSLRRPGVKYWCKNLLEKGAAVTLGPVAEPYTIGFPKPHEFFEFLVSGKYTVVECYWRSQLFTSWMSVLIGDPLYRPFAPTNNE